MYRDGEFQPACGMNLGWGMMHWCRECRPPKTADEIIRDFEDFMFPKQEMPDDESTGVG
jgi:hypothetical protein